MSEFFNLKELAAACGGQTLNSTGPSFSRLSTDSREDLKGAVFLALKGENFDGHTFLMDAVKKGASALIVESAQLPPELRGASVIRVTDTLRALQDIAHAWRMKNSAQVVGISGSNGKTTTKEFASALIQPFKKTIFSPASFNNHVGVPKSLLLIQPDTEVALLEMGMNHAGELTRLAEVARPDVVVITSVGRAHIEFFGTTEAIAKAKEELYVASPEAMPLFNLDNSFTEKMYLHYLKGRPKKRPISFSLVNDKADIRFRLSEMRLESCLVEGRIGQELGRAQVGVFGRQNINNLMAAAAIAMAVGVKPKDIWSSLPLCKTSWGRNQLVNLENGTRVIFDAYNANPDSMAAMVRNLVELSTPARRILVLGEMLEMGPLSPDLHEELARMVAKANVDLVWFIGAQGEAFSRGLKAENFKNKSFISNTYEEKLAKEIQSMLNPDDVVVIKGSRGMKLERVLLSWQPRDFSPKSY